MRLLFATGSTYMPERVGGSEFGLHALIRAVRARGHEASLLARTAGGAPIPSGQVEIDYPVQYAFEPAAEIREAVRRTRADAVILCNEYPLHMAAALADIPVGIWLYMINAEFEWLGGDPLDFPLAGVFVNSKFLRRKVAETYGLTGEVLPPLVSPERVLADETGGQVTFINPSRVKGVDLATTLARVNQDIPFSIVESWDIGDSDRRHYQERVADLPNVDWSPPTLDMRPVYARTRLLIVPSVWEEAWGLVVSEAQINGIPVLASHRGGLPESVGRGGVVLPPNDLNAWDHAVRELYLNQAKYARYSQLARENARTFSTECDIIVERFLARVTDAAYAR